MNDMIKIAIQEAGLASASEPPGIDKADGSRPDGIAVFRSAEVGVWFGIESVLTFSTGYLNKSGVQIL